MEQRRGEVEEKLVHGKKMLNRALKTAKGFEWQKLVKRIGHAKEKGEEGGAEVVVRLERELKVLKVRFLLPKDFAILETRILRGRVGCLRLD